MPTKQCTGCQAVKPLSEFARKKNLRDGRDTRCKSCRLAYMREYYTRRFGRTRPQVPEGHKYCPRCKRVLPLHAFAGNARRHDGKQTYCRECWSSMQRGRYAGRSTEARAAEIDRKVLAHRREPLKHRARLYVSLALYFGDLRRGPCEVCGVKTVQGHHNDYHRPLAVRWLCKRHHDALHESERTQKEV